MSDDSKVIKYLNGLHLLEINPNTNWDDYDPISQLFQYKWSANKKWYDDDNEKWAKGKWVSYQKNAIFLVIGPLICDKESTQPFLDFAKKVMRME
jgi:hypothetical protein